MTIRAYTPGAYPTISLRSGYSAPVGFSINVELDGWAMDFSGHGYLAGTFPDGITSVEGVPGSAEIRILYRAEEVSPVDGALVAAIHSNPDGTWLVEGINLNISYDVVGRKDGFNDVIVANVSPTSMIEITYAGAVVENETFTGAEGYVEIIGGMPPYSVAVETPFPTGLFPIVDGRKLIIDGTTGADEVASFDVKVTSSNGAEKIIPLQLVVGFKAPANFKAETVVVDDVFSVSLTWEVTNSTQQIKVYRSATPFDLDDLPEPIATLSGTPTTYTDDDVIEADYFYYMVTAVCEHYELESEAVAVLVTGGDPHWDKVVALLHFDGDVTDAKGLVSWSAQNTTYTVGMFDDCITFARTADRSKLFATNAALKLGLSDFTIEFFAKVNTSFNSALFDMRPAQGIHNEIMIESDNGNIYLWMDNSYAIGPYSAAIPNNSFVHIALVRETGVFKLFVAGVKLGSISKTANLSSEFVQLGASMNTGFDNPIYDLTGCIDELRITKGVARYTENFTPPSEPFLNR